MICARLRGLVPRAFLLDRQDFLIQYSAIRTPNVY